MLYDTHRYYTIAETYSLPRLADAASSPKIFEIPRKLL